MQGLFPFSMLHYIFFICCLPEIQIQMNILYVHLLNLATLHTARAKMMPGGFPHGAGATETQLLLQGMERDRKSRERRENGPASPLQWPPVPPCRQPKFLEAQGQRSLRNASAGKDIRANLLLLYMTQEGHQWPQFYFICVNQNNNDMMRMQEATNKKRTYLWF